MPGYDTGLPRRPRQCGGYRIRWANVQSSNGCGFVRRRMCIAERKTRWFGWWPVIDADWRFAEVDARRDIDNDRALRSPIPAPIAVD